MTQKVSGGANKAGRSGRKPSAVAYRAHDRRRKNKLVRVRQSNGEKAALQYKKGPTSGIQFKRVARGKAVVHKPIA